MIPEIRKQFNDRFSEKNYRNFLDDVWKFTNGEEDFRICETPLFIDNDLSSRLQNASNKIAELIQSNDFLSKINNAVPNDYYVPNETPHPIFLQVDFAVSRDSDGSFAPELIELQGFPSLYSFQSYIDEINRKFYSIPDNFITYFNGYSKDDYLELLRKAILGGHKNENVILLEIEPEKQKTLIDFILTEKYFGVKPVCMTKIKSRGKKLYYSDNGKEIPIERIYNRVIFDELVRRKIETHFDLREEADVEWAGHPNWFFKISKHTLPLLKESFVPKCYYLNELNQYPENLNDYVLKPLYSFAGSGVKVDVTKEILDKINDKENYILQEKVEYAPLIETPEGKSYAEIRMMFVWLDKPILVNNLLRTSKGKMMGVDFNKGKTWVGSNIVYHP